MQASPGAPFNAFPVSFQVPARVSGSAFTSRSTIQTEKRVAVMTKSNIVIFFNWLVFPNIS